MGRSSTSSLHLNGPTTLTAWFGLILHATFLFADFELDEIPLACLTMLDLCVRISF